MSGVRDGHRNRKNRCDFGALRFRFITLEENKILAMHTRTKGKLEARNWGGCSGASDLHMANALTDDQHCSMNRVDTKGVMR